MNKRRRIRFTENELAFIMDNRRRARKELHEAFVALFRRKDVTCDHIKALCTRRGWNTGRTGYFKKGQTPANKGKKMPFNANSARTQFKKGRLPHNTRGAGHERVDDDGYVWIVIDERNPHTGAPTRSVMKHRWLWEKMHGPIPDGMCLKCKGDKRNTDPSNWELVDRALLPRLNGVHGRGYDEAPPELKPTIMAVAKLEHTIREKARSKASSRTKEGM